MERKYSHFVTKNLLLLVRHKKKGTKKLTDTNEVLQGMKWLNFGHKIKSILFLRVYYETQ